MTSPAVGVMWFEAFGCRFGLAPNVADARVLFERLYAPFAVSSGPGPLLGLLPATDTDDAGWHITRDGERVTSRPSLGSALQELEYAVCVEVIEQRGHMLVLHGATVSASGGCAFITGFSESGKTTLSLALAARGYAVGGDDVAFFDPRTDVIQPMPRCAHLSDDTVHMLEQEGLRISHPLAREHLFVTAADLGGHLPPLPLRLVILLEPGTAPDQVPTLSPISQAEMTVALMREAGWENEQTPAALAALARLAGGAEGYRLTRGPLRQMADIVAELLGPPPERGTATIPVQ